MRGTGAVRLIVGEYVAFDLETTGLSPEDDDILEIGMVRFLRGEPEERWSTLVNPGRPVPLKTLRLTHIDPAQLLDSPPLEEVIQGMREFMGDLPLVGHNSAFDAAFLARRIPGFPMAPLYDTLELARIVVPGLKSYKLSDLGSALGIPSTEAHRAYDDAEVSGRMFRVLQVLAGRLPLKSRAAVISIMGDGWTGKRFFLPEAPADEVRPTGSDRVGKVLEQRALFVEPGEQISQVGDRLTSSMSSVDHLIKLLERDEAVYCAQVPMTTEWARMLATAAKVHAETSGKRVLLLGFPQESLVPGLLRAGLPEDFACLGRIEEALRQSQSRSYDEMGPDERRFLASLYPWISSTASGCWDELQMGSGGFGVVPEVCCPRDMKCRDSCPKAGSCFYLMHEAGVQKSGTAWAASIYRGFDLAGRFDEAIVWGCQDLGRAWQANEPKIDLLRTAKAAEAAGLSVKSGLLAKVMERARQDMEGSGVASDETISLASELRCALDEAVRDLRLDLEEEFNVSRSLRLDGSEWVHTPLDPPVVWGYLHELERGLSGLNRFLDAGAGDGFYLRVVERSYGDESERGPALALRHLWPGVSGVTALSRAIGKVLLTSDIADIAFETQGGKRMLGLLECGAPVCFGAKPSGDDVSVLVVDPGRRVPTHSYATFFSDVLFKLASQVKQGLLAMFPSRSLLKDTYSMLGPKLEAEGIALYGQGTDGGHRVVEHLAEDGALVFTMFGPPHSDDPVPQCIFVSKIPFAPPNPLDAKRQADLSSDGNDGFSEVHVRPPVLALMSHVRKAVALGRRLVIVFADPRLCPGKSNWGNESLKSFAEFHETVVPESEVAPRVRDWLSR